MGWKREKAVPENWWKLGLSMKRPQRKESEEKKKGGCGQMNEAG